MIIQVALSLSVDEAYLFSKIYPEVYTSSGILLQNSRSPQSKTPGCGT